MEDYRTLQQQEDDFYNDLETFHYEDTHLEDNPFYVAPTTPAPVVSATRNSWYLPLLNYFTVVINFLYSFVEREPIENFAHIEVLTSDEEFQEHPDVIVDSDDIQRFIPHLDSFERDNFKYSLSIFPSFDLKPYKQIPHHYCLDRFFRWFCCIPIFFFPNDEERPHRCRWSKSIAKIVCFAIDKFAMFKLKHIQTTLIAMIFGGIQLYFSVEYPVIASTFYSVTLFYYFNQSAIDEILDSVMSPNWHLNPHDPFDPSTWETSQTFCCSCDPIQCKNFWKCFTLFAPYILDGIIILFKIVKDLFYERFCSPPRRRLIE